MELDGHLLAHCPSCGGDFEPVELLGVEAPCCNLCELRILDEAQLRRLALALSRALTEGEDPRSFGAPQMMGQPLRERQACPACGGSMNVLDGFEWAMCEHCRRRIVPYAALPELARRPALADREPHDQLPESIRAGRRDAHRGLLLGAAILTTLGTLLSISLAFLRHTDEEPELLRKPGPQEVREYQPRNRIARGDYSQFGIWSAMVLGGMALPLWWRVLATPSAPLRLVRCPSCDTPNPDHEKNCLSCGASLGSLTNVS